MKTFLKGFLKCFAAGSSVIVLVCGIWLGLHWQDTLKMGTVLYMIQHDFLYEVTEEQLVDGAIKGMVEALGDPYASYIDEQQISRVQQSISGTVYGIGVYVNDTENGEVLVLGTIPESPAEKAGILPEDLIVAVDDEETAGKDLDTVVATMRSGTASPIKITVLRNGERLEFNMIRYPLGTVKTLDATVLEDGHTAYVAISKFSARTAEEFAEALNSLREEHEITALLLDLRNNGGGELNSAVTIARLFVEEGPIVHIVYKNDKTETVSAIGRQIKIPTVILVNKNTASASEVLAGALKDTGCATLVGEKTYGKGVIQLVRYLPDVTAVKMTQAKYLTPNKNDIQGIGISPDAMVEQDSTIPFGSDADEQFAKALEILRKQSISH